MSGLTGDQYRDVLCWTAPWGVQWLRHELRDGYWKHGSICENYAAVQCPVLAIGESPSERLLTIHFVRWMYRFLMSADRKEIRVWLTGGWKDAYTDAVFRMVQHLPNGRGIVGPWPHEWPDTCTTGEYEFC